LIKETLDQRELTKAGQALLKRGGANDGHM
jgi:hypothetical protein